MRGKVVKIGLSAAVAVLALGLMAWSLSRSSASYVKVDELLKNKGDFVGQGLWLGGRVAAGSHRWKPAEGGHAPLHRFVMEWKGKRVTVEYQGRIPAGFAQGRQITVHGKLTDSGVFVADDVTTKCPSKYEARR